MLQFEDAWNQWHHVSSEFNISKRKTLFLRLPQESVVYNSARLWQPAFEEILWCLLYGIISVSASFSTVDNILFFTLLLLLPLPSLINCYCSVVHTTAHQAQYNFDCDLQGTDGIKLYNVKGIKQQSTSKSLANIWLWLLKDHIQVRLLGQTTYFEYVLVDSSSIHYLFFELGNK